VRTVESTALIGSCSDFKVVLHLYSTLLPSLLVGVLSITLLFPLCPSLYPFALSASVTHLERAIEMHELLRIRAVAYESRQIYRSR
jgi:hypothetical protein